MDAKRIGETVDAWGDLGPTRLSPSFARPAQPSGRTLEIAGKLGLRYPPASTVDRESHAARVALLAEDCADIDPDWLDAAASAWAKREPFMPRACELRAEAIAIGRITDRSRLIAPPDVPPEPKPVPPPLTDEEIARLPEYLVKMGVSAGEITQERADRIRAP